MNNRITKYVILSLLFGAFLPVSANTSAQAVVDNAGDALSTALIARVNNAVDTDTARLVTIFKDLHQHPEIAFTEIRTAAIVARELKALGFTVSTGIGKTGVVGVLKNGPGPAVWFRADMDANAVKETTGLPYIAKAKQRLEDGSESMLCTLVATMPT